MGRTDGGIGRGIKKKELSSLFMTHQLNVIHAPVQFHEYIPYSLGLWPGHRLLYATKTREDNSKTKNARVVFLVHDTSY